MSGLKGTIGSPEKDKVAAWIYDRTEGMDPKKRNRIFKLVHDMRCDSIKLHEMPYYGLRERLAKLLKFHYYREIERLFSGDKDLCDRLRNLAVRNYRLTLREEDETMDGME